MKAPFVWLDGCLVPHVEVQLLTDNHTLHYGTGVFEGIRSYAAGDEPYIFELEAHIQRLLRSAQAMRIEVRHSVEQLINGCFGVLQKNGLTEAYLRPLVFIDDVYGAAARSNGQGRTVILASAAQKTDEIPLRAAIISSMRRSRANSSYHHAKTTGQYSMVHFAVAECRERQANQAVFLDEHDMVCECLTDNLFMVNGESVITPPTFLPIIQGITRATVINLLHTAGLRVIEREFTAAELSSASEIFTTSTAGEIQAITLLEGMAVGDGRVGSVTQLAARLYGDKKRHGMRLAESLS